MRSYRRSTDVKGIASDWWSRCLDGERLTGPEVTRYYHMNEAQFNKAKQYMRQIAKEYGIAWGYYPDTGQYILVGNDESGHAKSVMTWALRHAKDELRAADDTSTAMVIQGHMSEALGSQVHLISDEFDKRIDLVSREIDGAAV